MRETTIPARLSPFRGIEWASLGALALLILSSPSRYCYDEPVFVNNIALLETLGPGPRFIAELKGQSPGPLYQYVHLFLKPLTGLHPVSMRLANLSMFVLIGIMLQRCFNEQDHVAPSRSLLPAMLRSPTTWVLAGLALTEMPAILFLVTSLAILWRASQRAHHSLLDFCLTALAGLLLGIAVTGRTQFLAVIGAAIILVFARGMRLLAPLYCISASVPPLAMFWIWGGLVPPDVQSIQSGLNPYFGLTALGYLAFITFFQCPQWFALPRPVYLLLAGVVGICICLNAYIGLAVHVPLKSMMQRFLAPSAIHFVASSTPALLVGGSLLYLACFTNIALSRKQDVWFLFICLALILTTATCIKSSAQFSSRYVAQATPFIVLLYKDLSPKPYLEMAMGSAGAAIGAMSLYFYYAG